MAGKNNLLDVDDVNVGYETSEGIKVIKAFEEMKLKSDLLRGVYAYGFERSLLLHEIIIPIITLHYLIVDTPPPRAPRITN